MKFTETASCRNVWKVVLLLSVWRRTSVYGRIYTTVQATVGTSQRRLGRSRADHSAIPTPHAIATKAQAVDSRRSRTSFCHSRADTGRLTGHGRGGGRVLIESTRTKRARASESSADGLNATIPDRWNDCVYGFAVRFVWRPDLHECWDCLAKQITNVEAPRSVKQFLLFFGTLTSLFIYRYTEFQA